MARASTYTGPFHGAVYQGLGVACDLDANISIIEKQAALVAAQREGRSFQQVLVFPETFLCGYDISKEDFWRCAIPQTHAALYVHTTLLALTLTRDSKQLCSIAQRSGVDLVVPYAEEALGLFFNSAAVIEAASGRIVLNYRKVNAR
jgi:predicted amidohydrolase